MFADATYVKVRARGRGSLGRSWWPRECAWVHFDDGKANLLTDRSIAEIDDALNLAEDQGDVVAIYGRPGIFSGDFDLKVLSKGLDESLELILAGFRLGLRLMTFPRPVVMGCTGHAIALGAFLLLAGDHRLETHGRCA